MVHCGVSPPYLSPAHPKEGDYSRRNGGDYDAPGGYPRMRRNIDRFVTSAVLAFQTDNAVVGYGKI
jgi:hypothetical protein